jgi:hypothetical protein
MPDSQTLDYHTAATQEPPTAREISSSMSQDFAIVPESKNRPSSLALAGVRESMVTPCRPRPFQDSPAQGSYGVSLWTDAAGLAAIPETETSCFVHKETSRYRRWAWGLIWLVRWKEGSERQKAVNAASKNMMTWSR